MDIDLTHKSQLWNNKLSPFCFLAVWSKKHNSNQKEWHLLIIWIWKKLDLWSLAWVLMILIWACTKKLWCKRSFAPFYKHYIKCEDTKDFQKRIDYNVTNGVVFLERSIEMCPLDVYAFRNEICPHSTYCDTCGRELHYIPLEWAKSKLVNGVSFHYYMIYTCLHGIECNLQKNA